MTTPDASTEPPDPVQVWNHRRKGLIAGVVLSSDEVWITIRCTEPNSQADAGETLTFRRAYATEVTS